MDTTKITQGNLSHIIMLALVKNKIQK